MRLEEPKPERSGLNQIESINMNFEDMSNRQIVAAAKRMGIVINYCWSCGGGREDTNRDHATWQIEIWTGWGTDDQKFEMVQANNCGSGRWDGKAYCERAAKRIALIEVITRLTDEA